MQQVTIIGLGLIGGSIGLGLRQWSDANSSGGRAALEVTGFDTDLDQQHYAQKIKAVDKGSWDLAKAVSTADLVVVATPVGAMAEIFETIAPHLKRGAVVTDTGSTKAVVLDEARRMLPRTVSFVGGHPMAGKSQSIEAAEADLFKGATWIVAPSVHAGDDAVRTVLGMVAALGAEPYFVDPHEHDAYVAGISHLPFLISAALMNATSSDPAWRDMKTLTAGGFRDVSRLAAGSPTMHRDIVVTNRDAVIRWIDSFVDSLSEVKASLQADDERARKEVLAYLTRARDARAEWATQTTREGELLHNTGAELAAEGVSDQMGRMLLGGFSRRRRALVERSSRQRNERSPRS